MERRFPILGDHDEFNSVRGKEPEYGPDPLRSVPWDFLEPHAPQAIANHDQTLDKLASRGGLSPLEIYAVVNSLGLIPFVRGRTMTNKQAMAWIKEQLFDRQRRNTRS